MSTAAKLTPRQAAFIPAFLATGNATASAIKAGFSEKGASVAGTRMLRNASVQAALQARQAADAIRLSIQRNDVLVGLLEAVNEGRRQSNPAAMIAGLREIAKLQGYYAPETKRVEIGAPGEGAMKRMESMSDAELLAIIEAGSAS